MNNLREYKHAYIIWWRKQWTRKHQYVEIINFCSPLWDQTSTIKRRLVCLSAKQRHIQSPEGKRKWKLKEAAFVAQFSTGTKVMPPTPLFFLRKKYFVFYEAKLSWESVSLQRRAWISYQRGKQLEKLVGNCILIQFFPRPKSKHNHCNVCKSGYEDYRDHIHSELHKANIRKSSYNRYIKEMEAKYNVLNQGRNYQSKICSNG